MTQTEKISMLRNMIDSTDSDETLATYLRIAEELILNLVYPLESDRYILTMPERYTMKQIEIAAYFLNKRGAEGEIQHIENGVHRNYGSSDVPEAMIRHIMPYCGVVK